jgi:arginyl-tRNA synthetase
MVFDTTTIIKKALIECAGTEDVQLIDGGEHADVASTVAFGLAKQKKQAPIKIAQDIVAALKNNKDLAEQGITVEAKGPYINFVFGSAYVSAAVKAATRPVTARSRQRRPGSCSNTRARTQTARST